MIVASVQAQPLDTADVAAALGRTGAGGIATFTGLVRADDGVSELMLEHYPGITERVLGELASAATARWALLGVAVVHRIGAMMPGDTIVFVGAAAPHRAAALEACAFLIDRLKTDAPFWKREVTAEGARWVDARSSDDVAAERWREP